MSKLSQPWPISETMPGAPDFLDATAKGEWARCGPALWRAGRLTELDTSCFAAYCCSYSRLRQAERPLNRKGLTTMARAAARDVLRFGSEFGLTPHTRRRFADVPPPVEDPASRYLDDGA